MLCLCLDHISAYLQDDECPTHLDKDANLHVLVTSFLQLAHEHLQPRAKVVLVGPERVVECRREEDCRHVGQVVVLSSGRCLLVLGAG